MGSNYPHHRTFIDDEGRDERRFKACVAKTGEAFSTKAAPLTQVHAGRMICAMKKPCASRIHLLVVSYVRTVPRAHIGPARVPLLVRILPGERRLRSKAALFTWCWPSSRRAKPQASRQALGRSDPPALSLEFSLPAQAVLHLTMRGGELIDVKRLERRHDVLAPLAVPKLLHVRL